jgi:beta-N-acetylhexosaminidase
MSGAYLSGHEPLAVIFGCAGPRLTAEERDLFGATRPVGFILFRRNCETPDQVRELAAALRDAVEEPAAPILIDQEGGRVARLGPPHWRRYPSAARVAALGGDRAQEAAFLSARLIADDLMALGISVDCMPVLDLPVAGSDPVIGDRAYGSDPGVVARLGRAAAEGLLAGGVLPVVKHIPGHGRAAVDSHFALPRVAADVATLERSDFAPFRALRDMPWAMTAHVLYEAIDPDHPATLSARVIGTVIRASIGFEGVLISDDLSMHALGGSIGQRARDALAAGCDMVLHCNGDLDEMRQVASAASAITANAKYRLERGDALSSRSAPFDRRAAEMRLDELLRIGA